MKRALDTTLELETPEHIEFRYQLAGPARRGAAYLLDLLVRALLILVMFLIMLITSMGDADTFQGFETGALLLLFFVMEWGYFVVFDLLSSGRSPGKRAFRLRVIHQNGRPVSFSDSVLRNLLRAADLLPLFYAIGLVSMTLDRRFRRLGDFVAQTVVVYEPITRLTTTARATSVPQVPGLPARPHLTSDEREALTLFERRRGSLSLARARELADLIAPRFIERYGLGPVDSLQLLSLLHERGVAS